MFIAVDGVNADLSRRVEEQMAGLIGKPLDSDQLDQAIMRLKGFGRFSVLSYSFEERNGQQGLLVKTEENTYGPPIVRPLILIDGSSLKNVTLDMGARITFLDFGGFRSEWRTDFILFSDYGLNSEYYHPFTPLTHWFVAPRVLADNNPIYLYDNNQLTATYRRYHFGRRSRRGLSVRKHWRTACRLRRWMARLRTANRKREASFRMFLVATAQPESNTGWIASTIL